LGGRVAISNETNVPIVAILGPDGGLAYLPTAIGQSVLAAVTVEPLSFADTLASMQARGSLIPWSATRLNVRLDGIPEYAVVPRLRLGFGAIFQGQPIVVGEGAFIQAPVNTRIAVASGGAITLQPPSATEIAPLPGFVVQVKVLGKWITPANGRVPASAPARFAQIPSKTWICHGPGGSCTPAT
jgi:hypothetical protein